MKNFIIIISATLLAIVLASTISVAQDRALILSGGGPFANGNLVDLEGWTTQQYRAQSSNVFGSGQVNSLDELELLYGSHITNSSLSNALVIGYDLGGLAFRGVNRRNSAASSAIGGLVLVGVPNNGSILTRRFFTTVAQTPTQVESTIDILEGFSSAANGCVTCDQVSLLNDLNARVNDPDFFGLQAQAMDESPYLNSISGPTTIPTVVLYGEITDEPYPLSRILGSTALQSNPNTGYVSCMEDELEDKRREINDEYADVAINQTIAFAAIAARFATTALNPTQAGDLADGLEAQAQAIRATISAAKQRDRELGELLECEYVFQAMNAEWTLWTSRSYDQTTTVIVDEVCCSDVCWELYGDDEYILDACIAVCFDDYNTQEEDCEEVTTEIVTFISREENDGIYAHSEMDLEGAVGTYIMSNTDHKQEVASPDYEPARSVYQDLYAGAAGAAFALTDR